MDGHRLHGPERRPCLFGYYALPTPEMFLVLSGAFGFLWMFVLPFLVPMIIEADPTRRAAVLIGGAQVLGCSFGPFVASMLVTEIDARARHPFGGACLVVAVLIAFGLHQIRPQKARWRERLMATVKQGKRKSRKPALRAAPIQERAVQTRDRLLDIAGELLGEVGIERISTNMIAANAGVSPAALYRYFKDKYAVLEALGRRLMDRQNAVLFAWLEEHKAGGLEALGAGTEDLLRATAEITDSEPGGVWILRAMRAVPQLGACPSGIAQRSHRRDAGSLCAAVAENEQARAVAPPAHDGRVRLCGR